MGKGELGRKGFGWEEKRGAMEEKKYMDEKRNPKMGCLIWGNFAIKRVMCSVHEV